ncbi:MAG: diaminohydroxyphosphoribosylaminopyrimidine deaminase [Actinomycetota bacterium]|nr:diaminohydroxyphosphoribosylaminopyrimidine deaminase [Actinomycetota bacterium]
MGSKDEEYMERALELARGPAATSPNPRVGAVLVRAGEIIGEGAHEGSGTPHAEAVALEGADARGATLYVTLEPCAHFGKKPPCTDAIIASGVTRVVAAIEDPDERVRGRGFAALRAAGIEVSEGTCAAEAEKLNAPFLHHRRSGKPYVTLKLALSLDGRMAAPDGSSRWITGPLARRHVHARRLESDMVLVGAGTVLADDPSLLVTEVPATRQPLRAVVDSRGVVPPTARILDGAAKTLIATTHASSHEIQTAWKEAGAEVLVLSGSEGDVDLAELLETLGRREVVEIYCEGGARLATSLLGQGLVNRLEVFHAPLLLGAGGPALGDLGIKAIGDASAWTVEDVERVEDDVLTILTPPGNVH